MASQSSNSGNGKTKAAVGTSPAGKTLTDGVYVAGRNLAMGGLGSLGGHQFIVLIPSDPAKFTNVEPLGNGVQGIVIGAYNQSGRLQYAFNAPSDSDALEAYLTGTGNALGLEIAMVEISKAGKPVDGVITAVLDAAARYEAEEMKRPINYPPGPREQFSTGCLNSNSWAQSVIQNAVGTGVVQQDFPGIDTCKENQIDPSYFTMAAAPSAPVPLPTAIPAPVAAVVPTTRTYIVKNGDSLAKIAHHYYGDAQKWPDIYKANKAKIANPKLIRPGDKLTIP